MDNVHRLRNRIADDPALRKELVLAPDRAARDAILAREGLPFTDQEFEEACRAMLVKCQTAEEAEDLAEFRHWWELVRRS
jgi:hypothetical protein